MLIDETRANRETEEPVMSRIRDPAPTREQWMLALALSGVVQALNAAFVVNEEWAEQEAVNADPDYEDRVAALVAEQCDPMMIDDAIGVLQRAYEISTRETH
jgi:hypothetical protein